MLAAFSGQAGCVQELLGVSDPNALVVATDERGCNALVCAISGGGHTDCVRAFLQHSPDAQLAAVTHHGFSALIWAAGDGHVGSCGKSWSTARTCSV